MKTTIARRRGKPGYVSYFMVLSTGVILTLLSIYTYRRAMNAHAVQSDIQLRIDYSEKEEAILRSIVAITPNRAIRAMQPGSNSSSSLRNPLRWQSIFSESLSLANAASSIPSSLVSSLNLSNHRTSNTGDSSLTSPSRIFRALNGESGYMSAGINRSLGTGFPPPLSSDNLTVSGRDPLYPIISRDKYHGQPAQSGVGLSVSTYPQFNLHTYPQINFGYARPGEPFLAKRNWWAFSMNVASHDADRTYMPRPRRNFVLSIYEIPSQLAISADSFMSLGRFESGEEWQNVTIDGGVFAGKAVIEGDTALTSLASRRGFTKSSGSTIGGESFETNPFTPGLREEYQITQGEFFPVSLPSESGRVAFVPINRGADYFDRLSHTAGSTPLSTTTWDDYSIGALQCAMRLDITDCVSDVNPMPTKLRFSYMKGGSRQNLDIDLVSSPYSGLPPGYIFACNEYQSYDFGSAVVDVAYGKNGSYAFQTGVTGLITFDNARFGDPLFGVLKSGYYKPSYPFEVKTLPTGKICIAVYPQRFPAFLAALNADPVNHPSSPNNSLVVNVDYTTATGSVKLKKPAVPCTELDYGVILQECGDLSPFTRGFSLVSNLRTYIGDDFNIVPTTPPAGYTPDGDYFPPTSIFVPERRYGVEVDPFAVVVGGQLGSLAGESVENPVNPVESRMLSGRSLAASRVTVNLRPIKHPADLPPITMMNWLVVLEEQGRRHVEN
ncbi:MAG TPA: hypothetical protein VLO11_14405 [Luteolibacter sp.]|nr:hypothetical protein [Luteolibacter sp.]